MRRCHLWVTALPTNTEKVALWVKAQICSASTIGYRKACVSSVHTITLNKHNYTKVQGATLGDSRVPIAKAVHLCLDYCAGGGMEGKQHCIGG